MLKHDGWLRWAVPTQEEPEDRAMRLAMELWEPHTEVTGDNINNDDTFYN